MKKMNMSKAKKLIGKRDEFFFILKSLTRVPATDRITNIESKNMTEILFLVEEAPEGDYQAKALSHAIFTEGENIDELKQNIKDALECHFDDAKEKPKMVRLHLVKEEVFAT